MPLDQAEATRLLDAMLGLTTYPAPTGVMQLRLMSAEGTATANGVEVVNSGGSAYAPQDLSAAIPASATAGGIDNDAPITFTNMPAITTTGIEVWETGTPRRACYGALAVAKETALGDSLTFAGSALQLNLG